MKPFRRLTLLLGLCLSLLAAPPLKADLEVSFDYFYEALAPYGDWVEVEGYGPCWAARDVDQDWSPYTEGQWVYTDAGWTWVGDEPFAGIVYHYGRWIQVSGLGWCWVPGYDWGPAWVAWRDNEEYVGWAPLPPEVVWEQTSGVGVWVDEVYGIGPSFYSFCHHRDLGERHLRSVILARNWNTTILVQTVNITNITYNTESSVVYCGGPSYERACRYSSRPISALRLDRREDFHGHDHHQPLPGGSIVGATLAVVAPRVIHHEGKPVALPKTGKVIGHGQVNLGWQGKGASGDLASVREKIHSEVKGFTPTTHPAKPVAPKDLVLVPQHPRSGPKDPVKATAVPVAGNSTPVPDRSTGALPYIPPTTPIPTTPRTMVQEQGQGFTPSRSVPQTTTSPAFNIPTQQHMNQQRQQAEAANAEAVARQQAFIQQGREAMERRRQQQAQEQVSPQRFQPQSQPTQAPEVGRTGRGTYPFPQSTPQQIPQQVAIPQAQRQPAPVHVSPAFQPPAPRAVPQPQPQPQPQAQVRVQQAPPPSSNNGGGGSKSSDDHEHKKKK